MWSLEILGSCCESSSIKFTVVIMHVYRSPRWSSKSGAVSSFLASPSQRKFPGRLTRILSAYGAWVRAVAWIAAGFTRRHLEARDAIRAAARRVESVHAAIPGPGVGQLERSTQEPGLDRHVDLRLVLNAAPQGTSQF